MRVMLPIGSVVVVGDQDIMFMVTGYNQKSKQGNMFDYVGVQYPHGLNAKKQQLTFNENEIKGVINLGYQDKTFDLLRYELLYKTKEEQGE